MSESSPFVRTYRALSEWVAHSILCIGVYGCIQGVRWLTHVMTIEGQQASFFGIVQVDWLFDASDLSILLAFGYFGVLAALRAYRG